VRASRESEVKVILDDAVLDALAERAAAIVLDTLSTDSGTPERASPYLTIPEAAQLLRCKRQRVDDLLSSGRLTRVKEGRRTLVRREEIEDYLTHVPGKNL
jgi:excisionase family DNA binding protein